MMTTIPTIDTLKSKTRRELDAIFKKAAEGASDAASAPEERAAARQTMDIVRRCLPRHDGPG